MAIVTRDRYLEKLFKFVYEQAGALIDGTKVLKLNPVGLHYVQSRLEALQELEGLLAGAPVDYLRAYISDLGDHRALEHLGRVLRLLTTLKVVSALPPPGRDPTPLSLLSFGRLKVLELRGCDLSTSAAKGLLELRHTLEKIICHNSTDALRHVFASRIGETKDSPSPQWRRLSFVSCACNRLLLMDESLQLLPAVETLDLSRNKFGKVDNLGKCAKLKHLDIGFNHLRSISSLNEVSCCVVKLVLRNNALTTLRGIENLKSLEGLDVSYNIISKFSELEFLVGLSFLQSLWLEGNPLCCARWYRAQVFSYFSHPENLKLDGMEIDTGEYWKRKIIVASREKRPPSFGFYSPAREWDINKNKIACNGSKQESTYICSGLDCVSCRDQIRIRENIIYEDGAEIDDLMNKVERLKKEHSTLWLWDWMDHAFENSKDVDTATGMHANFTGGFSPVGSRTTDIKQESDSFSTHLGPPLRFRKDLLHRRHNLVEGILQLSAKSYSAASSDSDTSCTEDDCCEDGPPVLENHNKSAEEHSSSHLVEDNYCEKQIRFPIGAKTIDKRETKRKAKRRVISVLED
ncbi:hypothetical protein V6N13_125752 [Hibiscus sabdariffa]